MGPLFFLPLLGHLNYVLHQTPLAPESWSLGATILRVSLKQCPVKKTTVPTRALAHKASMSGHTGSSVAAQPRPLGRVTAFLAPARSSRHTSNRTVLSSWEGGGCLGQGTYLCLTDEFHRVGTKRFRPDHVGYCGPGGMRMLCLASSLTDWLWRRGEPPGLVSWSFGFLFYQETFPGPGMVASAGGVLV